MRRSLVLSVCLLVALVAVTPLQAQQADASVSGSIADDTGGVIPGVNVTLTNTETGIELSTVTNDTGVYRISRVQQGSYDLTATLPGFKTINRRVQLSTGDSPTIDVVMEVGEVTEQITVEAETPLLQSSNATLSNVIEREQIATLPLAQGNPSHLLIMAPGASSPAGGGWKWDEPGWSITTGFYFHGVQGNAVGFTLNGINNVGTLSGGSQTAQVAPPGEAVSEIKIAHDYDASRGHHNGTTMDVTLKSGSNDWHGTLFGYFRESSWGANDFFTNRAGGEKLPVEYRRIGGSVNGPIFKDKTFFAFTYEDTFQKTLEFYGARTVPSAAMRGGDFSALLGVGSEYQIYDPMTISATGDGFYSREPFPNNIIPSSRIHAMSQTLMGFYPEANLPGGSDGTSNFQPTQASPTKWLQWLTRVDHTFGPSNRIFGSYAKLDNWEGEWRDYYGNAATGFWQSIQRETFGVDDVWTLSPNLLLSFRIGLNRATDSRLQKSNVNNPAGEPFDIFSLPLHQSLKDALDPAQSALPHIQIQGFSGIHDETRHQFPSATTLSSENAVDINRGNHNLKLGFDVRNNRRNQSDQRWTLPRYYFGSSFTNGPLNTAPSAQGQGFAAFLLGQPTGGSINRNDTSAANQNYMGAFIQDNWRATPKLTLNVGVRWEYFGPVTERFDRSVGGFAFNTPQTISGAAQAAYALNPMPGLDQLNVNGGIRYAGEDGAPRNLYRTPKNLLAPRAGFAYRISEETVLRGGYGLFHQPIGVLGNALLPILTGYSQTTDLVPTFDNGVTFVADITNPFPDGILLPIGNAKGLATNLGQSVSFFNQKDLRVPYNERWSLTLQHMLPGDTLVEFGYVGTKGTRIMGRRNLNDLPNAYLSSGNSRNQANIDWLGQSFANPFAGLIPGTGLNTSTISRSQLLRPYPHFTGVTLGQTNQGYSSYHGMEARLEKRLSSGHAFTLGYTFSRFNEAVQFLNSSDAMPFESIARADRPHNLKWLNTYELPWGRTHPAGGWQVTSVWQLQSGFPMNFGDVFTTSGFSPDNLSIGHPTVDKWFNTDAGFVRDSSQAPSGSHKRTFPLRFNELRSAWINFWDLSIIKDTHIGDTHKIRFQTQLLNAFNQTSFAAANTSPTSGSFGVVCCDAVWPRRVQFSVQWMF